MSFNLLLFLLVILLLEIIFTFEEAYAVPQEWAPCVKSITNNTDDMPDDLSRSEQLYDDYFRDGCGCSKNCHLFFRDSKQLAMKAHLDSLDADEYCPNHVNHQHLLLLGAMNALMQNEPKTRTKEHKPRDRKHCRTVFRFRGREVCRKFFLFAFGCGEKRIKNVMRQFQNHGISPKMHESSDLSKKIVKIDTNQQRKDAVYFMRNYAQQNGLQLPGR